MLHKSRHRNCKKKDTEACSTRRSNKNFVSIPPNSPRTPCRLINISVFNLPFCVATHLENKTINQTENENRKSMAALRPTALSCPTFASTQVPEFPILTANAVEQLTGEATPPDDANDVGVCPVHSQQTPDARVPTQNSNVRRGSRVASSRNNARLKHDVTCVVFPLQQVSCEKNPKIRPKIALLWRTRGVLAREAFIFNIWVKITRGQVHTDFLDNNYRRPCIFAHALTGCNEPVPAKMPLCLNLQQF